MGIRPTLQKKYMGPRGLVVRVMHNGFGVRDVRGA